MGINETRKVGHRSNNLYGKYKLYYSRVQQGQRAKEEVGIILLNETDTRVTKFGSISSRLLCLKIETEKIWHILQVYVPIEGTDEDTIETFYAEPQTILDEIQEENHNIILMGDWNARIRKDGNRGLRCMEKFANVNLLPNKQFTNRKLALARDNAAGIETQHGLVIAKMNRENIEELEIIEFTKIAINRMKREEVKRRYQEEIIAYRDERKRPAMELRRKMGNLQRYNRGHGQIELRNKKN
ncbi:hypothetical protein ILUMI_07293 [Ignelater luminosus]|uniref:Endonuclease/exonuclease/phosphatase domain-containing protein n=1 Tax=Ignelater luminosus TaxID=2038154 RepID=A0A8K0D9L1_IGNLU|nr:hypothetical protein ILUMI_07293 [Ignelater luminosus]